MGACEGTDGKGLLEGGYVCECVERERWVDGGYSEMRVRGRGGMCVSVWRGVAVEEVLDLCSM